MPKYGREITLFIRPYYSIVFNVDSCETQKEADDKLKAWLKEYPQLTKVTDEMDDKQIETIKSNKLAIKMAFQ